MPIDQVLATLLTLGTSIDEAKRTLVFVLGDKARAHIENEKRIDSLSPLSINAVVQSRVAIHILFLTRLQYLFMYLMKFEAEENSAAIEYDNFVVYGLDTLIEGADHEGDCIDRGQLRLCNLIFNAAFRIKRKHSLKGISFVPFDGQDHLATTLHKLEKYWEYVC